ncbi:hypothetical protein J6590_105913 [Homalodisca vitripennis]|nr:hypothetical protein J6590_105913 [Homalodisca vitripennis]
MKATREHCIHYALSAVGLAHINHCVHLSSEARLSGDTHSNTWAAMQLEQCLLLPPLFCRPESHPRRRSGRFWRPLPISRLLLDPHTALPRAHRRSSVAAGTQLKRGANSWAAGIARLRRPYGPASDHLGPCRLPTGRHFASPGVSKTNCVF